MDIKPKVEGSETAQLEVSVEAYENKSKRKADKSKQIEKKVKVRKYKPQLQENVEDQTRNIYFTSVSKLLDEENYIKLISPLQPTGHSMKYCNDYAIVIEVPPRVGMLNYMEKPVLF